MFCVYLYRRIYTRTLFRLLLLHSKGNLRLSLIFLASYISFRQQGRFHRFNPVYCLRVSLKSLKKLFNNSPPLFIRHLHKGHKNRKDSDRVRTVSSVSFSFSSSFFFFLFFFRWERWCFNFSFSLPSVSFSAARLKSF